MARIVMAMSGGVDSSVAAALLHEAGHDVIGVFMRHGEPETACATASSKPTDGLLPIVQARHAHKHGCCTAADAEDARRVAQRLGIPFYALNLSDDFARIIDYFVDEYSAARTPNPCVMCNNWLKFGKLFDYADSVGAEFVATGHYARLAAGSQAGDPPAMLRGIDDSKDQSYVLFGVNKKFLPRMMLPIGEYHKEQIRALAEQFELRVAHKPDSQDICFVTSGEHADFVRRRRSQRSAGDESYAVAADSTGEIALADGTVVGRHEGIESFTIGQRKGLRVAMGEPYYVTRIEAETRRVVIGQHHELARHELTANRLNWLTDPPAKSFACSAQIRYNSPAVPAQVELLGDDRIRVVFDQPCHGVAPGQAVV
ncbi:MAG TPA: tRNA 2-thiouridine(34) synthase MnmA, partial [Pirellulales bacterium]